jgi:sulfur-carrier protein
MTALDRGRPARNAGQRPAVRVRLLYFAWLRARIGCAEEEIDLPPEIRDVGGLLGWLQARGGSYTEALRDLSVVRVAVNRDYVGREHAVRHGDEVAIFPPVTGG